MKHLLQVIQHKERDLEYAKSHLQAVLSHGTRSEQLLAIDHVEALRIELRAFRHLQSIINRDNHDKGAEN